MFNQVTIAGRITNVLELKQTTNGTPVLNFGIAVNEKRGGQEYTVFVSVTAWSGTAENTAKFMSKGSPILISGHLSLDRWEEGGATRSRLFVTAERVVFLESKASSETEAAPAPETEQLPLKRSNTRKQKAA